MCNPLLSTNQELGEFWKRANNDEKGQAWCVSLYKCRLCYRKRGKSMILIGITSQVVEKRETEGEKDLVGSPPRVSDL